jgi:hypothetical protein
MRAGAIVLVGVGDKHAPQMRFAKDDHLIQALFPNRSDQTLDTSVLPGRPQGSGSVPDAHSSQAPREVHSIDAIAPTKSILCDSLGGGRDVSSAFRN